MRQPLNPHERSILLQVEKQLRHEDPVLARRLHQLQPPLSHRLSPRYWPAAVFLVTGIAFLAAGLLLAVGSAVWGGLLLFVVAVVRSPRGRRCAMGQLSEGARSARKLFG